MRVAATPPPENQLVISLDRDETLLLNQALTKAIKVLSAIVMSESAVVQIGRRDFPDDGSLELLLALNAQIESEMPPRGG